MAQRPLSARVQIKSLGDLSQKTKQNQRGWEDTCYEHLVRHCVFKDSEHIVKERMNVEHGQRKNS